MTEKEPQPEGEGEDEIGIGVIYIKKIINPKQTGVLTLVPA